VQRHPNSQTREMRGRSSEAGGQTKITADHTTRCEASAPRNTLKTHGGLLYRLAYDMEEGQ